MKIQAFTIATILTIGVATTAIAEPIKASDPQSVMKYFTDIGAPATLTEDNVGDPMIEFQYYGTDMAVFFYGCQDGQNCNALQFFSSYVAESEVSMDALNTWNADERYGRVYQAEDGRKMLEYDIYTGYAGVDSDDFDEMFDIWTELVKSFEDLMS